MALLRSGYTLSARSHGAGKTCLSTGREATYRDRNAVARNRATSATATYPKGIKVSDQQMATLNLNTDTFHPEWNYTISPRPNTVHFVR